MKLLRPLLRRVPRCCRLWTVFRDPSRTMGSERRGSRRNCESVRASVSPSSNSMQRHLTYLFPVSAIPAKALYHAKKAAKMPKTPPAFIAPSLGAPSTRSAYPMPKRRNARSKVKNSKKNATVDRSVQSKRRKVKINHPWAVY